MKELIKRYDENDNLIYRKKKDGTEYHYKYDDFNNLIEMETVNCKFKKNINYKEAKGNPYYFNLCIESIELVLPEISKTNKYIVERELIKILKIDAKCKPKSVIYEFKIEDHLICIEEQYDKTRTVNLKKFTVNIDTDKVNDNTDDEDDDDIKKFEYADNKIAEKTEANTKSKKTSKTK